jgi:hypothetical protein
MNKITQIREGFLSINRSVEETIKRVMTLHANLVGDKVSGTGVKEAPAQAGIFGAILSWQTNVMHRLEVLNVEIDRLQDNIELQAVDYDKPRDPLDPGSKPSSLEQDIIRNLTFKDQANA